MEVRQTERVKVMFFSLVVSVLLTVGEIFLLPVVILGRASNPVLSIVLGAVVLLGLLVFSSLLLQSLRQKLEDGFLHMLGGTALVLLTVTAGAVVMSLLYGLLAVVLQNIFLGSMDVGRIRLVVDIVTSVLTVLVLPVGIAAIFGYGYHQGGVLEGMRAGLRGLRRSYFKVFAILVAGVLLGYLVSWLLRPGGSFYGAATAIKIVVLSLLGAVGIALCAKACAPAEDDNPDEL